MCTCASCEYTDRFSGLPDLLGSPVRKDHKHGWDYWPRGDPQGKRASERDYSAHVSHSNHIDRFGVPLPDYYRAIPKGQVFPRISGLVAPVAPMPAWWYAWNSRKSPAAAEAAPASPDQPGKADTHLPPGDRTEQPSATIYEMAKEKAKRKPGRPALPGKIKRIMVSLDVEAIERARKLGGGPNGNISAGIRKALGGKS
jgi:hypothetical protein